MGTSDSVCRHTCDTNSPWSCSKTACHPQTIRQKHFVELFMVFPYMAHVPKLKCILTIVQQQQAILLGLIHHGVLERYYARNGLATADPAESSQDVPFRQ